MLNWAVGREYIDRTPFRRGSETLIKRLHEDNRRRRRLSDDEEAHLLAAASPHLRSMIVVALDTGMRRGEMLALRFRDLLGHASITTTERYDTQKLENLQVAVTKLERGIDFDAITPGVGSLLADAQKESARKKRSRAARSTRATARIARTKFQESFKYEGVTPPSRTVKEVPAFEPNELEELNLENWLGVRDGIRNWMVTAA